MPFLLIELAPPIGANGRSIAPLITEGTTYRAVETFARLNLFLALFNLFPVLPLDGGRLLHSWLHRFVSGIAANKISGIVGVMFSILWIPLLFVAFFAFGFVLLFFPNIALHRRMMRRGQG